MENLTGQYVMYKNRGICKITEMRSASFAGLEEKDYYVLSSVYDRHLQLLVPVTDDPESLGMRRVFTKEEIDSAIDAADPERIEYDPDIKVRYAYFTEILNSGDRINILSLIIRLLDKKAELEKIKKKLYAKDLSVLNLAEHTIREEFAFVLQIDKLKVSDYIMDRIASGVKG